VACDQNQLHPAVEQEPLAPQRVALDRPRALVPVRQPGHVAEVDDVLTWEHSAKRANHGQPADTRVEHPDRATLICSFLPHFGLRIATTCHTWRAQLPRHGRVSSAGTPYRRGRFRETTGCGRVASYAQTSCRNVTGLSSSSA